ncbi:MAG TPA: type 4a pilus biogenesis protein PilO [Geomonas sp.]|nr:type 4a pilus biogenesis protein PilO [Geomonas sp.]
MNYEMLREIVAARRKAFLLLGFLALLNLVLYAYLSGWQRPELDRVQNDWFARREAQAAGQNPAVAGRYQETERDLALFQKRLIPKRDFASFLSKLFDTAKGEKLAIKGVSYQPAPVKEQAGLVRYQLGFTVSGGYPVIKRFIADLGRFPEAVTLDSLILENHSHTSELVDLRVQLTAYLKTEGT